jgi:hypothetical protein
MIFAVAAAWARRGLLIAVSIKRVVTNGGG